MAEEISVYVIDKNRKHLYMRYFCPEQNKAVERSTGTSNRKQAEKRAAQWEAELREGRYVKKPRMSWEAFRDYYNSHGIAGLAEGSIRVYSATFNAFERICNPRKLADLTTERVTAFAAELQKEKKSEATIARHLRHLKATARWAHRQGMLVDLPQFTMPKRVKGSKSMRGRAISGDEFDRMLAAVAKLAEEIQVEGWQFYLRGLWESGLRISESLNLCWDWRPGALVVDMSGRRPLLQIPAEAQKSFQDTLLPITPQFAAILESVPERERHGRVFKLQDAEGHPFPMKRWDVGRKVAAFGKAAGAVVDERERGGKRVRKYASAHDLRRAFGQRWARRVMPSVLRELMRHESIETTMKYYVGQNAEATADAVWAAQGDTFGDTRGGGNPLEEEISLKNSGFSVDRGGIEPPTPGFSVLCSTN